MKITFWIALLFAFHVHAQDTTSVAGKRDYSALIEQWSKRPRLKDSLFVAKHSDVEQVRPAIFHEGNFLPGSESVLKNGTTGNVIGPFTKENGDYILRMHGTGRASDSAMVSHILIAWKGARATHSGVTRTKFRAKKIADSLCALISTGAVLLEDIVESNSDDPGSWTGNKGNYGWMTRESGFNEAYKNAGFNNPVGSTFVIETEFGYHIIQVEAKSKEYDCYFAWQIVKIVDSCYSLDGTREVIRPGGFPGGYASLHKTIEKDRLNYPSIATRSGQGKSVMISLEIKPDGKVGGVSFEFGERLSQKQLEDLTALMRGLPPFIPTRSCKGPIGQTETYFFYY